MNKRTASRLAVIGLLASTTFAGRAFAAAEEKIDPHEAEARKLLKEKKDTDVFAIAGVLAARPKPLEAAGVYFHLIQILGNEEKDLVRMNLVGSAGIQHCLAKAAVADTPADAKRLKTEARGISYNLAANNWPGWGVAGYRYDGTTAAQGMQFARLNLRLVQELGEEPARHAGAHWIVGASLLSNGRPAEAQKEFETSAENFAGAKDDAGRLMAQGYAALAAVLLDKGKKPAFDKVVAELRAMKNEDATFYGDQLITALPIFQERLRSPE